MHYIKQVTCEVKMSSRRCRTHRVDLPRIFPHIGAQYRKDDIVIVNVSVRRLDGKRGRVDGIYEDRRYKVELLDDEGNGTRVIIAAREDQLRPLPYSEPRGIHGMTPARPAISPAGSGFADDGGHFTVAGAPSSRRPAVAQGRDPQGGDTQGETPRGRHQGGDTPGDRQERGGFVSEF